MSLSSSDNASSSSSARLPQAYQNQLNVLKILRRPNSTPMDLNDITVQTGHADEREAQRVLYILEGHRLVTPLPPGDLTSRSWKITPEGLQALHKFEHS